MARLWHYTTTDHLEGILRDREIRPAALYIDPGERPAAWFSTNAVWEVTAQKGVRDKRTGVIITPGSMGALAKYTTLIRYE